MNAFRLAVVTLSVVAFGFGATWGPKTVTAEPPRQPKEENVQFRWAFCTIVKEANEWKLVPITQDTTLQTGDRFKLFVELQEKCYVYVIYHSAQGEVRLLFPEDLNALSADYQTSQPFYIPRGQGWFALDEHVGRETFYLLASATHLGALEALIKEYASARKERKPELATAILKEIRKVKWQNRKFKTYAERPVAIVGRIRGSCSDEKTGRHDVSSLAVEISANNFYSRTFTIEHR